MIYSKWLEIIIGFIKNIDSLKLSEEFLKLLSNPARSLIATFSLKFSNSKRFEKVFEIKLFVEIDH